MLHTHFHLCVRITPRCWTDPLYAGTTLVLAQLLNYMQLGSEDPPMLLFALALVALGLAFLTLTAAAKEKVPRPEAGLESSLLPPVAATARSGDRSSAPPAINSVQERTHPAPKQISPRAAMVICAIAGLAGSGWSPLSTYARAGAEAEADPVHDTTICLVVFQLGQLLAVPSITNIASRLEGSGVLAPLRALSLRSAAWGILCGMCVSSGYVVYGPLLCDHSCCGRFGPLRNRDPVMDRYFTSSSHIPPTIVFGE